MIGCNIVLNSYERTSVATGLEVDLALNATLQKTNCAVRNRIAVHNLAGDIGDGIWLTAMPLDEIVDSAFIFSRRPAVLVIIAIYGEIRVQSEDPSSRFARTEQETCPAIRSDFSFNQPLTCVWAVACKKLEIAA